MAYNDAPSTKVPAFPDQFQGITEPVCNPLYTGLPKTYVAEETLLNTVVAVKAE